MLLLYPLRGDEVVDIEKAAFENRGEETNDGSGLGGCYSGD